MHKTKDVLASIRAMLKIQELVYLNSKPEVAAVVCKTVKNSVNILREYAELTEPECTMCKDRGYLVYQLTGMYNKRCKCNTDYGKSCRET